MAIKDKLLELEKRIVALEERNKTIENLEGYKENEIRLIEEEATSHPSLQHAGTILSSQSSISIPAFFNAFVTLILYSSLSFVVVILSIEPPSLLGMAVLAKGGVSHSPRLLRGSRKLQLHRRLGAFALLQ